MAWIKAWGVSALMKQPLQETIAWTLHQAFIVPLALAGVSAALLAETRGQDPDPSLCEKIAPLLTP